MSHVCPQSWCLSIQTGPVQPKPSLCQDQLISRALPEGQGLRESVSGLPAQEDFSLPSGFLSLPAWGLSIPIQWARRPRSLSGSGLRLPFPPSWLLSSGGPGLCPACELKGAWRSFRPRVSLWAQIRTQKLPSSPSIALPGTLQLPAFSPVGPKPLFRGQPPPRFARRESLRTPAGLPLPREPRLSGGACRGRTRVLGGSRHLRPRTRAASPTRGSPGALSLTALRAPGGLGTCDAPTCSTARGASRPAGSGASAAPEPRSPAPERRAATLRRRTPRAGRSIRFGGGPASRAKRAVGGTGEDGEKTNPRAALTATTAPSPRRGEMKGAGRIPRSPRNRRRPFSDPEPPAARPRASPARRALPPAPEPRPRAPRTCTHRSRGPARPRCGRHCLPGV